MKIAVLLPTHAHTFNKKHGSRRNSNNYYGLKIIVDQIQKFSIQKVDYVDYSQVHLYDVILYSMLSIDDYYSLVYTVERKIKSTRNNIWICGGSGISNINPLVNYFDYIVLGRGEDIIVPLLRSIKSNSEFFHQSVVYSKNYTQDTHYYLKYSNTLWEGSENTTPELMSGCKYNCSYCRYRTSSLPPNKRIDNKNTTMPGNEETFWELEIKNGSFYTTSLDGLTNEARKIVNKNIPPEMIVKKIVDSSKLTKVINLKIYFIIGYPHHQETDFTEFIDICEQINSQIINCKVFFSLHFTPFGAEPHTPMQWESVKWKIDYRKIFDDRKLTDKYVYNGSNVRAMIMTTTQKPFNLIKRMIFNRARLSDLDLLKFVGSNPKMTSHSLRSDQKQEILMNKFDLSYFLEEHSLDVNLPAMNIITWKPNETILKEAALYRKKRNELNNLYI